jgi:hypothetical protein
MVHRELRLSQTAHSNLARRLKPGGCRNALSQAVPPVCYMAELAVQTIPAIILEVVARAAPAFSVSVGAAGPELCDKLLPDVPEAADDCFHLQLAHFILSVAVQCLSF